MRSRYSAFALGEIEHLMRTQLSDQPIEQRRRSLQATCRQLRWRELVIVAAEGGGAGDLEGTVTFEAHYCASGERGVLRECSRFGREGGHPRWRLALLRGARAQRLRPERIRSRTEAQRVLEWAMHSPLSVSSHSSPVLEISLQSAQTRT